MKTSSSMLALAAAVLFAAWSPASLAQAAGEAHPHHAQGMMNGMGGADGKAMGPGSGMCGGMGPGMGMGMGMGMESAEQVDARLAPLHSGLELSAAQESAWNEYAGAVRADAESMRAMHQAMMATHTAAGTGMPTYRQHLAMQESMFEARLKGARAIRASFEKLYAVLSPAQRQNADKLLSPHSHMQQ